MSLPKQELISYTLKQLNTFFPDNKKANLVQVKSSFELSLDRIEFCFSKINSKYYFKENEVIFNHLNGDQYSMFLYFLSNTLYKDNSDITLCEKIFLLNKYMHSIDAFYEVELPDIFLFIHPLGTVLGRGKYSNYFIVYQRCGIGSNHDIYPTLGENLTMHPGSSILGNSITGKNCEIAAESLVIDFNIESNNLYIGNPKNYFLKGKTEISPFWHVK